jgi:hypothetical protein
MPDALADALRAPRLPSEFETDGGSSHGNADEQVPRAVFRRLMAEEIAYVIGPVAERMRADADRMEAAVMRASADVEHVRCLANKIANYAEEMHESKRHIEHAHRELLVRIERIEQHVGLT